MPRKPRVFVVGGAYHVYCRVSRGERPFADEEAAKLFLDTLARVRAEHGLTVLAWYLMPYHYHLFAAVVRSTDQISRWTSQASRRKAHDGEFRLRLAALDVAITSESPRRE